MLIFVIKSRELTSFRLLLNVNQVGKNLKILSPHLLVMIMVHKYYLATFSITPDF